MAKTITWKTKWKAKERSKNMQPARTKEGRESVPFTVESYLTHSLSNVVSMQIVKSSSMGCLDQASLNNTIFLFIAKLNHTKKQY
jgi:hypothetical protein